MQRGLRRWRREVAVGLSLASAVGLSACTSPGGAARQSSVIATFVAGPHATDGQLADDGRQLARRLNDEGGRNERVTVEDRAIVVRGRRLSPSPPPI